MPAHLLVGILRTSRGETARTPEQKGQVLFVETNQPQDEFV